ncbi:MULTISPECIES: helix-turn-helix domain-containing protein [Rhizobium]|uniref:Transcriptional regulator n=1 Tax=Rhizobium wuzhouense TaxID=1986026 RepID=A0ABX5NVG4_9HYPH|nr:MULTISPECIES: helix-turn-helix transcriptional regulator [Rhizobium]PYB75144.1 transcriptional regulator [Rhizobium wuzhouense]RKE84593.1 transcriptional regulator with XRE-family HTH domain [Rhizobium sp. AG855]
MSARRNFARMTDCSDDTLGGRLSMARDTAGLSLADVANRVGVRKESLLSWEADRAEPRPSKLIDLAGILGVSPMWLMTGLGAGPIEESADLPLEALRMQLQRLTDAHQECGRLIGDISRQIDRYEAKNGGEAAQRNLDGPMMGRA